MITMITTIGSILTVIDIFHTTPIAHIFHTIPIKEEIHMYYKYQPYPFYNRYYNIDPYYYRKYYNPYYNYMQNIINSQIANSDQNIVNYGDMSDVIQDSVINQSMAPPPTPTEEPIPPVQ